MIGKKNLKKEYLYKKSYLERRLQSDVMENGIAYIPCKVESMHDIISKFSIDGCESLDTEFMSYIMDFVDVVPMEHPVVLEIYGPKFSPGEKKTITETITSEMAYQLGRTEEYLLFQRRRFLWMILGTILSSILLTVVDKITTHVPREFFYVVFWLFADAFVRYIFVEKLDYKDVKLRMGRLASIQVEFVEQDA